MRRPAEAQDEPVLQCVLGGGPNAAVAFPVPRLWGRRANHLLSSDLQLFGRGPPTLGRATCFTQSTENNQAVLS